MQFWEDDVASAETHPQPASPTTDTVRIPTLLEKGKRQKEQQERVAAHLSEVARRAEKERTGGLDVSVDDLAVATTTLAPMKSLAEVLNDDGMREMMVGDSGRTTTLPPDPAVLVTVDDETQIALEDENNE